MDEEGIGLDSLSRLEVVAAFDEFFGLRATGIEDYLYVAATFGAWVNLLGEHVRKMGEGLSLGFRTSGTTGPARVIRHPITHLYNEARVLTGLNLLSGVAEYGPPRVAACVPPQHLFGFMFTVLVPDLLFGSDAIVIDHLPRAAGGLPISGPEGSLVVATPYLWSLMLEAERRRTSKDNGAAGAAYPTNLKAYRSCRHEDGGDMRPFDARSSYRLVGVVSGAPAEGDLWHQAANSGVHRLVDVCGATETGGIGWRDSPDHAFTLLGHFERDGRGDGIRRKPDAEAVPLQDRLTWIGPTNFTLGGRLDKMVQVAGVNVSLQRVRQAILAFPGISDAAVRLSGDNAARARLKAFLVPDPSSEWTDASEERLRAYLVQALSPPERPVRIDVGPSLPTGPNGKPCDWP